MTMMKRNKSWVEEQLDQDVRVYKEMLDARDALRSDLPDKKLVPMRSVQHTFGTHLKKPSATDEEPLLLPVPHSGGAVNVCSNYLQFWDFYDVTGLFRHHCLRTIQFDFDTAGFLVDSIQAYTGGDNITDDFGRPFRDSDIDSGAPISWWFIPDGTAVWDLMNAAFVWSPVPPDGIYHIEIWIEMHQEYSHNPSPPPQNPFIGDETSSIPKVIRICVELIEAH